MSVFGLMAIATAPLASATTNVPLHPGKAHVLSKAHRAHKAKHVTDPTIYDSIVDPSTGNLVSVGFEATEGYQLGNQINFADSARVLDNVVVQMSSWGCEQGGWNTPSPAAFPPAPANGNIVQAAPGSGAPTSANWGTFTDQLNTTGNVGSVTFATTVTSPSVSVSSSGLVTTVGSLPSSGLYTVSGTDSDTGSNTGVWSYTLDVGQNPCLTNPGATFSEPVTLNIYNVGNGLTPGSLIATETQTFNIPYRPSENDSQCTGVPDIGNGVPGGNSGGWYDSDIDQATGQPIGCLPALLTNLTFSFGHLTLPNSVIYGIAYNTSDYGSQPYTHNTACGTATDSYVSPGTYDACGYDSLNVGLSEGPPAPSVGSDPTPGAVYWDTTYSPYYCDSGADGSGIFRLDSPEPGDQCWTAGPSDHPPYYVPAVQFNAVNSPSPSFTSLASANVVAGTPFSFTITTTGVPIPTVSMIGRKLPKGLTFHNNGDGTATISGTASVRNINKSYSVVLKARNGRNSSAKQRLILTLTGGRA